MTRRKQTLLIFTVVLLGLAGFGFLAVWLGQDYNWDLFNYHFYKGYAFLGGRFDWDVQPAQLQTYFNPLVDVPFYLLASRLSARVATFTLGAIHGLNFFLLLGVCAAAVRPLIAKTKTRWLAALPLATLGFIAPASIAEHGTSMTDNTVTIPFLASVWLLLRTPGKRAHWIFLASGILAGAGVALKQSIATFVIGLGLALVVLPGPWKARLRRSALWVLGVVVAFAILNGPWMLWLWCNVSNPVFPIANNIFHSPYYADIPTGKGYIPGYLEFFQLPLRLLSLNRTAGQFLLRDARLAMLIASVLIGIVAWLLFRKKLAQRRAYREAIFFTILLVVGYVLWERNAYVYRYLIPLELLAPLTVFLIVSVLVQKRALVAGISAMLSVLLLSCLVLPSYGRGPFEKNFFEVSLPELPEKALVIMTGGSYSYLVPFFPDEYRFVRIDGNIWKGDEAPEYAAQSPFGKDKILPVTEAYEGTILTLRGPPAPERLAAFGFVEDTKSCHEITVTNQRRSYFLCPVHKK